MEGFQPESASEDASRESGRGYGKFLVELAELLTIRIVLDLATYFSFPRARYEELQQAKYPGKLMTNNLQERGFISASGISPLIKALEDLKLDGVKNSVLSSYKLHTSDNDVGKSKKSFLAGQLEKLKFYLKLAYERLYRAIQPIPYIRDRLFCVNEVFVEGGIVFNNVSDKSGYSGELTLNQNQTRNKSLKSYTELFDDDIVPSKRVIVEGEPGYGKSTLTLQAAYDWCERKSSSLKGAELLILLPLRLLKGITSFYEAIKLFILPSDCTLTTSDIEGIISSCSSVVIILDGYDEYPDMNNDLKSHIKEIIKGKMFSHFKVILSTRSGCLPQNLDPRTIRVRLTGFDEDARDRYVRMAVVGGSSERTKDIRQNLEKNPIMCDLCQVPLFFVMVAHMAHESTDIYKCNSVTSFFKYMIHCFYSHMWKKGEEMGAVSRSDTADKRRLYKLAFDGLTGGEQNIVWEKIEFCREVGTECFEELIRTGILVEEKILEINMTTELSVSEYIQEKIIVRFYHKLFAEWYAAHYVSERASSFFAFFLSRTLRRVNPIDLQFVFRFACGLKPSCTKRIANYLRKIDGGKSFATLCILEQTGGTDDILDTVRDMCSSTVEFSSQDSQLLHRSRTQLFDIAAKNQVCSHRKDNKVERLF
ncbi:NLR family CARD domain-containing protein 4 [Holothuria leucospilota]|uniref:NLR family CARD domain-containing protein 4 n=1 Tax=Holothuria leucospilota TaxID=206669 RepID=A0A9Q0YCQ4_HOLLE|nr:NLR family CARD domain-containing protein 4 [Holothuria leucospilota]